ncbi:MAG: hypothetical protein E5V85_02035 [Mesorhizobium sp.]|nr:MAG: hypothetical protein E5V85_02035 [Mesorhizobium sp.]
MRLTPWLRYEEATRYPDRAAFLDHGYKRSQQVEVKRDVIAHVSILTMSHAQNHQSERGCATGADRKYRRAIRNGSIRRRSRRDLKAAAGSIVARRMATPARRAAADPKRYTAPGGSKSYFSTGK